LFISLVILIDIIPGPLAWNFILIFDMDVENSAFLQFFIVLCSFRVDAVSEKENKAVWEDCKGLE